MHIGFLLHFQRLCDVILHQCHVIVDFRLKVPLPKGGLLAKLPTFIFRELAGSGDAWELNGLSAKEEFSVMILQHFFHFLQAS